MKSCRECVHAEIEVDAQHGPIMRVSVGDTSIAVYLMAETGVVTNSDGSQYGIEIGGAWHKFRASYHPREEK